jgi:hypothetical protein
MFVVLDLNRRMGGEGTKKEKNSAKFLFQFFILQRCQVQEEEGRGDSP